jgi:hypothetical protein
MEFVRAVQPEQEGAAIGRVWLGSTLAGMGDRRGGRTPWRSFVPRGPIGILTCIALSAIAVVALGGSLLVAALVVPLIVVCVMTAGHLFFNPFDEPPAGEPPAPPAGVREPRPPGGPPRWEAGAAARLDAED